MTNDDLAADLRHRVVSLAWDRYVVGLALDAIRRRVPTCGNPPIHQKGKR